MAFDDNVESNETAIQSIYSLFTLEKCATLHDVMHFFKRPCLFFAASFSLRIQEKKPNFHLRIINLINYSLVDFNLFKMILAFDKHRMYNIMNVQWLLSIVIGTYKFRIYMNWCD